MKYLMIITVLVGLTNLSPAKGQSVIDLSKAVAPPKNEKLFCSDLKKEVIGHQTEAQSRLSGLNLSKPQKDVLIQTRFWQALATQMATVYNAICRGSNL